MTSKSDVVVVIDDMIATLALMSELLGKLGFQNVKQATSGEAGLGLVHDIIRSGNRPSVIFLDWHMPGMSGIAVLRELKADPATRQVPVIMISAEEQSASLLQAIEQGAADYIIKPISEQSLAEKLRRVFQKQD